MGERIYRWWDSRMALSEHSGLKARAQEMGARLAQHSERPVSYSFHVLDSSEVNAMASSGGHIYVTSRLLETYSSDAQLAFILGHEVGHMEHRDDVRLRGMTTLRKLLGNESEMEGVEEAVEGLEQSTHAIQREYELAADIRGVELMMKLGYDPEEALRLIAGWDEEDSVHPPPAERLRHIREWLRKERA